MDTAQFLEKLPRFIQELKHHGYSIGTDEAVNAHKIILKDSLSHNTDDEKNATLDSVYLQQTLSPVFCSSEEQQQHFRQHLDHWLARNNDAIAGADEDEDIADDATPPSAFSWPAAMLLVIALALGISAFLLTPVPSAIDDNGDSIANNDSSQLQDTQGVDDRSDNPAADPTSITEKKSTKPTPSALVRWLTDDNSIRPLMLAGMLVSASIALLLWRRRRAQITRGSTDGEETTPFSLSHWAGNLHAPIAVRKSIQRLRVHELVRTNSLDINASIRATIAHGGLFHPITGTRPQLPEFILLIESNSVDDHQRVYSMQWYHYLLDQGLIVTPYWYTGTPWQELFDEQGHRLSWQQLVGQNNQKRLLVMGDAERWFHPITGQLPSQSQDISEFSRAALLTPKAVIDWDNHEWQFQQLGLVPFHFDVEGVQQLSNYWQQDEQHLEYTVPSSDRPFPSLLEDYQIVDYRDLNFVKRVVASLEDYLSPKCFKLLCATAIYPECHFGITRHLAADYLGDLNSFNALDKLSPLCRLPWMRRGVMPDHLRLLLLQKLDRKELDQLRNKLARNLKLETGDSSSLRLRRFLAPSSLTQRWLRKLLGRSEHSSFSRDAVFVKIMSGKSPLRLTLASATAQRWNKLVQQRWFMAIAVTLTMTATIYGWLETVPEISTWISSAVDTLSYVGFFVALSVAAFFVAEFYRNRPLPFRYPVKLVSQVLVALNLVYFILTELTDSITLSTSLPYYQCAILMVILHLQSRIRLPLSHSQSNNDILNAIAALPVKTLARWIVTWSLALYAFNLLLGTPLFSLINRDQNFWDPTGDPLGALPQLASDFSSSLFMASMVAAIAYSLRPYLGWSHREAIRGATISIEVKFLLMAIFGGFLELSAPLIDSVSDSHFLKAIISPAMSYPAAIIALGIQGVLLGMFARVDILKKGVQLIAVFSLVAIAYYPLARALTGTDSALPQFSSADFSLGGFLVYCLLIGTIKREDARPIRDAIGLLFSLLFIIALSTIPSIVVSRVWEQSITSAMAIGLLQTLVLTPAVAVVVLLYVQRRTKFPSTQFSEPEFSTENSDQHESTKSAAIRLWGWCLVFLCGISFSGLSLYWADNNVSFYSEALLYLATLWIFIAHRHALRRAFTVIAVTALAATIALPILAPLIQVLEYQLEATSWLNFATLLSCFWLVRYLSQHWQGDHLSLPSYNSLWRPLGLLLVSSVAVEWYVTDSISLGWGLAWLPVWVLLTMGRSFSPLTLYAVGLLLCLALIAGYGVDAWLLSTIDFDALYLSWSLYGLAVFTIPMALFLGYWLARSNRLLSSNNNTLMVLLPLLCLCMIQITYTSNWPVDESYYVINGSFELAHGIVFALGFISRRHLKYGAAVIILLGLFNAGQWISESYAEQAPQKPKELDRPEEDLQQRPLPPTLNTISESSRQQPPYSNPLETANGEAAAKSDSPLSKERASRADSNQLKVIESNSLRENEQTPLEPETDEKSKTPAKDEAKDSDPNTDNRLSNEPVVPPQSNWTELLSGFNVRIDVPVIILLSLFLSGLSGQWLRQRLPPRFSSGASMKHATNSREETKQYSKR